MGHPLVNDLSKLTMEELVSKQSDIVKRMTFAYRMGRADMIQQLQMIQEDYNAEISKRGQKALEEMEKNSKQFKNIIDIQ
jgi:hypothetical protein